MTALTTMVPADVLCELAHRLTERECHARGIRLDVETDDETVYTEQAQDIFIELYDLCCGVLDTTCEGGQP